MPFTPDPRLATLADVDELVRLRALMMRDLGVAAEPTWADACVGFLRDTMSDGSTGAMVVDDPSMPGQLVACGVGCIARRLPGPNTPNGRHGYIASMVTVPGWRGRGLATGIVTGLLGWFTGRDVHKVDLHASAAGEQIYRRLGFTEGEFPELRWRAQASRA